MKSRSARVSVPARGDYEVGHTPKRRLYKYRSAQEATISHATWELAAECEYGPRKCARVVRRSSAPWATVQIAPRHGEHTGSRQRITTPTLNTQKIARGHMRPRLSRPARDDVLYRVQRAPCELLEDAIVLGKRRTSRRRRPAL
jgi:hypothetical protein